MEGGGEGVRNHCSSFVMVWTVDQLPQLLSSPALSSLSMLTAVACRSEVPEEWMMGSVTTTVLQPQMTPGGCVLIPPPSPRSCA